jgi:hypothetical protein
VLAEVFAPSAEAQQHVEPSRGGGLSARLKRLVRQSLPHQNRSGREPEDVPAGGRRPESLCVARLRRLVWLRSVIHLAPERESLLQHALLSVYDDCVRGGHLAEAQAIIRTARLQRV